MSKTFATTMKTDFFNPNIYSLIIQFSSQWTLHQTSFANEQSWSVCNRSVIFQKSGRPDQYSICLENKPAQVMHSSHSHLMLVSGVFVKMMCWNSVYSKWSFVFQKHNLTILGYINYKLTSLTLHYYSLIQKQIGN